MHRVRHIALYCCAMSEEAKTYEEILTQLEQEVERLERGDLPLEEALAAFENGMKLATKGGKALESAEKKVEVLVSVRDGEAVTRPLDD